MILRRLITWFRQPGSPKAPEAHGDADGPLDLNEFGRLLTSGKAEDLQKIARILSRSDNVRI
jgi:hypothetical protein